MNQPPGGGDVRSERTPSTDIQNMVLLPRIYAPRAVLSTVYFHEYDTSHAHECTYVYATMVCTCRTCMYMYVLSL
jgi:hypothetical protein